MPGFRVADLFRAHMLNVHLPNIFMGICASIEIPLVTVVGRRIGATHPQIANFVLVSSMCRTALDIPFGILVEYAGVRQVMLACLLLNAAAAVLGSQIINFSTMQVFCALSGASLGGFFLSRHIFVAGISSKKYRGMFMSVLSGLLRWSHVVGPLVTGLIASKTGDARNSFFVAAGCSLAAFVAILVGVCTGRYQQQQQRQRSCNASLHGTSDDNHGININDERNDVAAVSVLGMPFGSDDSIGAMVHVDDEALPLVPPLPLQLLSGRASGGAVAHPSLGPGQAHHFHVEALWYTVVDCWPVIWRLGVYVIFFGAIRSNRKLMLAFSGMREGLSDSQIQYMLSVSFAFSAMLFPLGGIIMDFMGRQFAMAPVAVSIGLSFLLLPWCHSERALYMAAAVFGVSDAMGCGVIMTVTADRAPRVHGAPFFGIMRTIADMGHVVGAGGVSFLVKRYGHDGTCVVLAAVGIMTAVWGVCFVPRDTEPLDTPRLDGIGNNNHDGAATHGRRSRQSSAMPTPHERPLLASDVAAQQRQQQKHQQRAYGTV